MSSAPFQLSQMTPLGCAAPRHWLPHLGQVSLQWLSFFLVIWHPRNCAFLGPGMWPFPEVTIFSVVCFFWELLAVFGKLVLKWPLFALKSDFLSIEATCLLILGALLSHSTLTKPSQYDAAWHVCVHHVESNGMILLGDLVLDIYQKMPIARPCLHHCRIETRSGCCLTSPPLAVHPYISEETRSWIYAMECS